MQNYETNVLKQEWMENLDLFTREMDYPREAAVSLSQSLEQVFKSPEALSILTDADLTYSNNIHMDYKKILNELKDVSPSCGVHTYTLHMLFFIILSRKTRKIYEERGIAPEIFRASMMDLHWKLLECKKMFGIWGTSVADWQIWWFEVKRFALGRFQYELVPFEDNYEKNGISLHPGDLVINVHIPSCGPLRREEYMQSYAMAADFFRDSFEDRPVVFCCESWMLFPEHRLFLPKTSNILGFMQDYDIYKEEYNNEDLWRIFYEDHKKPAEELPQDTGLQRAYRSWLMEGHQAGLGFGVFIYDKRLTGEKV